MILLITLIFIAVPPENGRAAIDKQSIPELELLDQKVSIADLHDVPITQASGNVYVITDEDIRQSGAPDLPTILRRIPGLEIIQMTGAQFDVAARGDINPAANKMLVLVDGRSIFLDIQGDVFWKAIPVTLPEIKRIEVLKGPASALYGFNAFDGVINIITKSPEQMKGSTLQFGGGEYGTISAAAVQAGTLDKFGYRVSAGRDQNNQWRNRDALAFRDHKLNIHTNYNLAGQSRVILEGGIVDVNRYDGPVVESVSPAVKFTDGYARVGYERPNFFIYSFWKGFHSTAEQPSSRGLESFTDFFGLSDSVRVLPRDGNPVQEVTTNTYDVHAQHALDFGTTDRFTYGVNYRHNTVSGNAVDTSASEDRLGLYFQNEWTPIRPLSFIAGLRYDFHNEIHATLSPRVAILYRFNPDHALRAGVSVAYRPPTLFQTHFSEQAVTSLFGGGVFVVTPINGSPNLKPEEIVSYELGYQGWFFRHRLRVRADLFYNRISDLITTRTIGSSVSFVNDSGLAEIYGGEAGVEFLATSWLTGFANYSYEEISQNIGNSPNDTLRRAAPRFKANAGLRGDWETGISSEVAVHYVGATTYPVSSTFFAFAPPTFLGVTPPEGRVGSYILLNIRAGYRFWRDKAEVAVSAFNALNDRHREHPLGDTIGSRVMGWLTLRF